MSSKAHFTIEQIDNGYLVDAHENDTEAGFFESARFFVANSVQLLDVLASALIVRDAAEKASTEIEEALAEWPGDDDPTVN